MRIGILRAGRVNPKIVGRFGEYPRMAESLIQPKGDEFTFEYWPVTEGGIPDNPSRCDGWLVTGSRHGVYDDLPWIAPTGAFLRNAIEADRPVLGICFGHQLLAHALGGRVEKSDRGWGIGVQEYNVVRRPPWMSAAPDRIAVPIDPPGSDRRGTSRGRACRHVRLLPHCHAVLRIQRLLHPSASRVHPGIFAGTTHGNSGFQNRRIGLRPGDPDRRQDDARIGIRKVGAPILSQAL